jgi:hypothetical protein
MQTVTFKADQNLIHILTEISQYMDMNRSEVIRNALICYQKNVQREQLKYQIKQASLKVSVHSLEVNREFIDGDGLDDL